MVDFADDVRGVADLLYDVKTDAVRSLTHRTVERSPPPYPELLLLWQIGRFRTYRWRLRDDEAEDPLPVPFRRRLWLWRRGFTPSTDLRYDLDTYSLSDYVSDFEQYVLGRPVNHPWKNTLDDKLYNHLLMEPYDEHRMEMYGIVDGGDFYPLDWTASEESTDSGPSYENWRNNTSANGAAAARVDDRLDAEGTVVLKGNSGWGGKDVLICSKEDGTHYVDGESRSRGEFEETISTLDAYLVCEFVEQADYSDRLFPDATNTIRVLTLCDDEGAFVPAAVHHIGTEASKPIDNIDRGGIAAWVDVESGELSAAIEEDGIRIDRRATHPDTQARIEGTTVPGWPEIRERIADIAESHAFTPYLGWDLLVDDSGDFTVVEVNSVPELKTYQTFRPLLRDRRTRRFFVDHGIVSASR
ncbi:sugar-transfer associated ATP-grasp domain-containing protein [Halorussus salinus]|uniref:sugar-transfer associated ATP-grasp domain-containing protein n=1 Tax=Halorussus salinus TaxID=1364935 RepID=UPI001092B22E|nr:sugar-transfer associated ATP-grasp domain-containing protein [Halorussus salinus]